MQTDKLSLALKVRGIAVELRDRALSTQLAEIASSLIDTQSAQSDWLAQHPIESFVPAALDHLEKIIDLIDQREDARRQSAVNEWVASTK